MRSAILFVAIALEDIAQAISQKPVSDNVAVFMAALLVLFLFMDIIEFAARKSDK